MDGTQKLSDKNNAQVCICTQPKLRRSQGQPGFTSKMLGLFFSFEDSGLIESFHFKAGFDFLDCFLSQVF